MSENSSPAISNSSSATSNCTTKAKATTSDREGRLIQTATAKRARYQATAGQLSTRRKEWSSALRYHSSAAAANSRTAIANSFSGQLQQTAKQRPLEELSISAVLYD